MDHDQPKLIKVRLGNGSSLLIVAAYQAPVTVFQQDKNYLPVVN